MANAIQELKLVLSLDTKAYQAGLKGAKTSLLGLTSAQVGFGMAAAQYAMRGIDALVRQYKEYDQALDKLSYQVTNYGMASQAMLAANVQTTASLRTVGDAVAVYASRLEMAQKDLTELSFVTAQYADDTGDSAGAIATTITSLANRWGKDAGGIASAMMQAGQISGLAMSSIGEQVVQATPLMKALGYSFETTLAKATLFNKNGYDFSKYVTLMQKNFEKFGGNVKAANREITTIENTVRGFKTQGEAVGYLMEKGFSSTAAIELAEMLRLDLGPELENTVKGFEKIDKSVDSASKTVRDNMSVWDKFVTYMKEVWSNILNPSNTAQKAADEFTKKQFERYTKLKELGYSRNEMSRILEGTNYDLWDAMNSNTSTKNLVKPGQVLKSIPSTGPWVNDDLLKQLEKQFEVYLNNPGPSGWNVTSPSPYLLSKYEVTGKGYAQLNGAMPKSGPSYASIATSDVGGSALMQAANDMYRLGDTGEDVANSIQGNLSRAFYEVSQFADNSSGAMRVSLVTAIGGASEGMGALAESTEKATEGVQGLNDTSQGTKSTWEQIEGWLTKAADKLGIDSELLVNNIWTGLARVGKESLEKLGVDVDGLQSKMADFFGKAKGYGFDINSFWKWSQEGTGQTTKQIWDQTLDQMAKATGNFIMQASAMFATGTVDWRELFSGLWRSILASTVTAVAKMVADWIAGLEIIAQAKAWLETMPGVAAALAIGAIAVGGIALLASSKQQPAMASGGVVMGPTNALIGEAGPEAVFPLEKLNDLGIPFGRGGRGASASVVNITVNNPILNNRTTESDVRAFMERISRELVRKGVVANSYA